MLNAKLVTIYWLFIIMQSLVFSQEFTAIPWNNPLEGHKMNIICPMQDDYLEVRDLSSLIIPYWIRTHRDPVGKCPVKYFKIMDSRRTYPKVLLGAVCACERSRCTRRGFHICITVYMSQTVLKYKIGFKKEIIPIDCICAAQRGILTKFSYPILVD